ncbi:PDE9A [Symbiodinium natans]|uniref:PDE9A protein n=1 Tax=Symbiodinium natans TaxID=878477 RepID=A0A812IN03_9DINO|nr:PDE9A [Symbiodinium natans]
MGFSWSSYIAQEEILDLCKHAGLAQDSFLACDCPTPSSFDLVAAAATDDVMIFSTAGAGVTSQAAARLDDAFTSRGAVRNAKKDVNDALCATCVGVDLVDGFFLDIPAARYLALIVTFLFLHCRKKASPKHVQQLLGALQWFDLLVRPKLSVYSDIYSFTGLPNVNTLMQLPTAVLGELACSIVLGIFWRCDLRRPFLQMLGATDASVEYGFGASILKTSEQYVRQVARWAEKQGAFILMDGGCAPAEQLCRSGEAHRLEASLNDFSDVFSVRRKHPAHINVLEGEAFILFLRWLLRSRKHHSHRVVILVDSAVWLGAAAKGRSSSQLNRLLRRMAALTMAGDLQLHLILVPSQENPSDAPSSGRRRKRSAKETC